MARSPNAAKITKILDDIATGTAMHRACKAHDCDPKQLIRIINRDPEVGQRYARAKMAGLEYLADEIHQIADESPDTEPFFDRQGNVVDIKLDHGYVAWQKNRIDARKWLLSKLVPKKYGDHPDVTGDDPKSLSSKLREAAALIDAATSGADEPASSPAKEGGDGME